MPPAARDQIVTPPATTASPPARATPPPPPPPSPQTPPAAAAPAHAVPRRTFENRRAPRFTRKSRAQLLLYPSGRHPHPIDVAVVDYSVTGIGIIHHEGLLVGQKFVVREPHVTHGNTCLFTVVRSDRRPDGKYSIGLHVGNTLQDELEPMVEIAPAPGVSRRAKLLFIAFAVIGAVITVCVTLAANP